MTIEISTNPHSFIAFMTLAMGISFVFFNPNSKFGAMRLLTLLFLIVPIVLMGNQLGHSIDILLGGIIGFCTARGLNPLSPVDVVKSKYYEWRLNKKLRAGRARFEAEQATFEEELAEAKARERAEQARRAREQQEREKTKQSHQNNRSSSSSNQNQGSSNQRQGNNDSSNQSYQKPKINRELSNALSVLGLDESVTYDEAKRTYRILCKEFHPDAQSGASESVKKMAEGKMKEINVAWMIVQKYLNGS